MVDVGSIELRHRPRLLLRLSILLTLGLAAMPASSDELTARDVLSVMTHRRLEIRSVCWEQNSSHQDTGLKVDFVVSASGEVTDASPRDESGSDEVISCVLAQVRQTRFPNRGKGGWFRWPFIFKGP